MSEENANRAFKRMAAKWFEMVEAGTKDGRLPQEADEWSLACLLLAVEWGKWLDKEAFAAIERNSEFAVEHSNFGRLDALIWRLCGICQEPEPGESWLIEGLTDELSHHNSSIRGWIMLLAWFVFPWLDRQAVAQHTMKNAADTLGQIDRAVALARRCFDSDDEFYAYADGFVAPDTFEEQLKARVEAIKKFNVFFLSKELVMRENAARQQILKVLLD